MNPHILIFYLIDQEERKKGIIEIKYTWPHCDVDSLNATERKKYADIKEPMVYSHTLTTQIGGQLKAGFNLVDFFEDDWNKEQIEDKYFPSFIATKAIKPI